MSEVEELKQRIAELERQLTTATTKIGMAENSGVEFSEYQGQAGPVVSVSVGIDPDVQPMIDEALASRERIAELESQNAGLKHAIDDMKAVLDKVEREREEALTKVGLLSNQLDVASDSFREARARLAWIYDQCNDPGRTPEEIGLDLCSVIAGGRVGDVIYPDEDAAVDEARKP